MNKIIYLTYAFVLGLCFSSVSSYAEEEQDGGHRGGEFAYRSVSPIGEWGIELVSADESGSVPFCAVYQTYTDNYKIFISLNPLNAMKMLVEIPDFEGINGQSYDIMAITEDGSVRIFEGQVLQDASFDMAFSRGDDFFEKLQDTRFLDMNIGDRSIHFQTPRISQVAQDLQACVDGDMLVAATQEPQQEEMAGQGGAMPDAMMLEWERLMQSKREGIALSMDDQILLDSLKRKIGILEREKESLRKSLSVERAKNLNEAKENIGAQVNVENYKEKISILEKHLWDDENIPAKQLYENQEKIKKLEEIIENSKGQEESVKQDHVDLMNEYEALKARYAVIESSFAEWRAVEEASSPVQNLKPTPDELALIKRENDKLFEENIMLRKQSQQVAPWIEKEHVVKSPMVQDIEKMPVTAVNRSFSPPIDAPVKDITTQSDVREPSRPVLFETKVIEVNKPEEVNEIQPQLDILWSEAVAAPSVVPAQVKTPVGVQEEKIKTPINTPVVENNAPVKIEKPRVVSRPPQVSSDTAAPSRLFRAPSNIEQRRSSPAVLEEGGTPIPSTLNENHFLDLQRKLLEKKSDESQ